MFISFEGIDGSGKTTQAHGLQKWLVEKGYRVVYVQEPGTTVLGQVVRQYAKSSNPMSYKAELLLFLAARTQLVEQEIRPNLQADVMVIADRFEASSLVYQGLGRGLGMGIVEELNEFATDGVYPDITFLLDLGPELARRRLGRDQGLGKKLDRFETADFEFYDLVREGFLTLAGRDSRRWVVLDGSQSVSYVGDRVISHLREVGVIR